MEAFNLQQLSLILDQDLVLIPGEIQPPTPSPTQTTVTAPPQASSTGAVIEESPEEEYAEEVNKINYEGNFEKGILVVYQGKSLDSSHRELLFKVLGAVGCSLKDVALLPAAEILALPPEVIDQLSPRRCLIFGSFNHPMMKFKKANYETVIGEREYFFADALEDLADNVQLKRNLWNGLQVLFQIKK